MGLVNSGIYKIINPEGKIYIGYTINLDRRRDAYKNMNSLTQPLIKESIEKYSWEQHTFDIIEYCEKEKLKEQEKYWIEYYDSFKNGLNGNKGGGGPLSHTLETKLKMRKPKPEGFAEKISQMKKGKLNPKISLFLKGKPSRFKGKTHTESTKLKQSLAKKNKTYEEIFGLEEALKQKIKRSLPRKGKNIICVNTGEYFSSLKEAAIYFNINANSISNILKGYTFQTKNKLTFRYAS